MTAMSPPIPMPPTSPTPPGATSTPTRRRKPRRWIPWGAGLALVVGLAFALRPQPIPVEIARITTGPLRGTIDEEGRTRIRERYVVAAPVSGQLRRIPFKAGDPCPTVGTPVAVIDPIAPALLNDRSLRSAEARRDEARATLEKARAALGFARMDLARFERLFREGTVSTRELESFQWREQSAAKELAAAEGSLRQAEAELVGFTVIGPGDATSPPAEAPRPAAPPIQVLAPSGGRILRVMEENARVVNAGTPLLEVGDPADLEVVIEVLSREAATIRPGTRVELDQWGGEARLQATVRRIEPAAFTKVSALGVEEQRVRVVADLLSPPDQRPGLGDGFRVETHIVVWEEPNALQAPAGALFRQGDHWAAFVLQEGRAVRRTVQVGRSASHASQILSGLSEGDIAVLYPGDRVTAGSRIRPVDIDP